MLRGAIWVFNTFFCYICDEYEDGGNYDDAPEKCWAFIGNYEWDFSYTDPLEYSSSSYPESRMCEFGDDTWAYSREAYHDYSCCTTLHVSDVTQLLLYYTNHK